MCAVEGIFSYVRTYGLNWGINAKFTLIGISTLKNRNYKVKLLPEGCQKPEFAANTARNEFFSDC